MTLFSGLSAFPLSATDKEGRLMSDVLERHLERIVLAGPDSVGLLGSTGSYAYLTITERMPLPADGNFGGELATLRSVTPASFSIGYSGDWGAKDALLAGADGWFSVVAGLLPREAMQLTRAAMAANVEEVNRIDQAFNPLWALFKEFGSFRVMYALANRLDGDVIEPLRPVKPLPLEVQERIDAALAFSKGPSFS